MMVGFTRLSLLILCSLVYAQLSLDLFRLVESLLTFSALACLLQLTLAT